MKLAILSKQTKDIIEYTISCLRFIATSYKHQIVEPQDAEILCISVCDVSEIAFVKKIRKLYPNKFILVGGHAAVYFRLFLIYADAINIGHGFEAFRCQSIDEILLLSCVATSTKSPPFFASESIDWKLFPVANVTKQQQYYIGAFGCKNKCHFCLTSWTHHHQINPYANRILKTTPRLTLVTNDSDSTEERITQSIMLVDFLSRPSLKKYGIYRIGVEFATESTRKRFGKSFTDEMFTKVFHKAVEFGVRLKIFCIAGVNSLDEWNNLFLKIAPVYQKGNWEVKFTNLNIEMFAPIRNFRESLTLDNYITSEQARSFISRHKQRVWPLKSMPCSSPEATLFKTSLCWSLSGEDLEMIHAHKKDVQWLFNNLKTNLFKNDYHRDIIFSLHGTQKDD